MKAKNENSINSNLNSGGLKMKTRRMITLLAMLLVGVMVNAQSSGSDLRSAHDQIQKDNLKVILLEYGSGLFDFFSVISMDQEEPVKTAIEKCKNGQDSKTSCTKLIRQGAKPNPYFPKYPDGKVNNPNKRTQ